MSRTCSGCLDGWGLALVVLCLATQTMPAAALSLDSDSSLRQRTSPPELHDVRAMHTIQQSQPAQEQDDALEADGRDSYTLTLYWENDGSYLQPNHARDRHYTNGLAATLTHQPQWADDIARYVPLADWFGEPDETGVGYIVGQRMFTPEDIEEPDLIEDDRPYAGHTFAGIYWQRARGNTLDHIQVNLGLVGPSTHADALQDYVHEVVNAREPRGWGNQLSDEPTFQTYLRRKWRIRPDSSDDRQWPFNTEVDFIPGAGLALGTVYRHVEGSLMGRMGWNLPNNFGLGRIDDPIAATDQPTGRWTVYGFMRTSMRLVEHNLFLAGNTWTDSHSIEAEPLVADFQFGAAVAYRRSNWSMRLQYSQVFQTDEFENQSGIQGYGALALSGTAWF